MKLEELIQKLEKATEGSEELDALIVAEINDASVKRYPSTDDFGPKNRWQFWSRDGAHFLGSEHTKRFKIAPLTRSLDAALTLFRVKPGLIETDARKVCIAALKARLAAEKKP